MRRDNRKHHDAKKPSTRTTVDIKTDKKLFVASGEQGRGSNARQQLRVIREELARFDGYMTNHQQMQESLLSQVNDISSVNRQKITVFHKQSWNNTVGTLMLSAIVITFSLSLPTQSKLGHFFVALLSE